MWLEVDFITRVLGVPKSLSGNVKFTIDEASCEKSVDDAGVRRAESNPVRCQKLTKMVGVTSNTTPKTSKPNGIMSTIKVNSGY